MPSTREYVSTPALWVGAETWSPPLEALRESPHAPPAYLWQPPPFVDLTVDESDCQDGGDDQD